MDNKDYEGKFCEECRFFKQHYAVAESEFIKLRTGTAQAKSSAEIKSDL